MYIAESGAAICPETVANLQYWLPISSSFFEVS